MRHFFLIILLLTSIQAFSQKRADIGIIGGGAYYQGDINHRRLFYSTKPAYGIFYRFNLNRRFAFRANLIMAMLSGDDNDFTYKYQTIRNRNFSTPLVDLAGQSEFNFKTYKIGDKKHPFSPYVFLGLSFSIISYAENPYVIGIPFGLGIKQNLGKRIGIGLEWGYRKTFSDYIDNISGVRLYPTYLNKKSEKYLFKQLGNFRNTDWYSIFGLFISYKLYSGKKDCYIYDK